ncbi:MAG: hypothetical protein HYS21_01660 [Deltaproteobacteria bacterium]|nr:hypothetical protein [Deltaproteobacteria bacterium]
MKRLLAIFAICILLIGCKGGGGSSSSAGGWSSNFVYSGTITNFQVTPLAGSIQITATFNNTGNTELTSPKYSFVSSPSMWNTGEVTLSNIATGGTYNLNQTLSGTWTGNMDFTLTFKKSDGTTLESKTITVAN